MNKLSVIKAVDISKLSQLRTVAKDVILRLNLGIEHESRSDLVRATRLLTHNDMIRLYQIRNTLVAKLKHHAKEVQQRARLTVAESEMSQIGDQPDAIAKLPLLSEIESDFLSVLINPDYR